MAGSADAGYLRMIDRISGRPYHIVMAIFTDVCRIDMRGVLARCLHAVVATEAVVRYARMVKRRRQPRCSCMAVVAVIAALHVRRILA